MRSLYGNAYLESGCTLPYDESTNVDNLTWTWATSYALAGVAFLCATIIGLQEKRKAILMILYFATTGAGYAVVGASHQFAETKDDWQHVILGQLSAAIVLLGNALLMRTGILFFFYGLSVVANTMWIAINAGIITATIIFEAQQVLVAGVALLLTNFAMCILYCWVMCCWRKLPGSKWAMFVKTLAMLVNIAALVEQYVLARTCGSGGYEDCFADCPLPDPTSLNHNAIFHILLICGLWLLAVGELGLPTHELWDYFGSSDDISDWETRASLEKQAYASPL